MSKYDFIKDKNIVPVHKKLVLKYEADYSGNEQELEINVYPFTVKEKLQFKNESTEATKLMKSKNVISKKSGEELMLTATYNSVFAVLKKDDKDITIDIVKKMPDSWYDKIIFKSLEFEGITEEQIKSSKKEVNTL